MPTKGSIGAVVKAKVKAGQPHGTGSATAVQARQARARAKEIEAEKLRKKIEARDVKRAKRLAFNPPNAGKTKKFEAKAIAKANERRAKAAAKAAARKAARKSKGFWG